MLGEFETCPREYFDIPCRDGKLPFVHWILSMGHLVRSVPLSFYDYGTVSCYQLYAMWSFYRYFVECSTSTTVCYFEWYTYSFLCIASVIAVTSLCWIQHGRPPERLRKKKKKRTRPPRSKFRRHKLPYHLVLRCRRRQGNRPPRIVGRSRRELLTIRREKRREYRRRAKLRKDIAVYEAWSTGPSPRFKVEEPDISLIQPLLLTLGPGGIPFKICALFDLDSPDPEESPESLDALGARANYLSQAFNKVETATSMNTPLVFDTGASSGLTPFCSDFLDDYADINITVKGVAGNGSIVGTGTTLRRYTTRCGADVYIEA